MKKSFVVLSALLLLAAGMAAPAAAQSRIGFKLGGGLGYMGGGDYNKGIQGWSDLYSDAFTLAGLSVEGGYKPVHLGMDLNGEFLFQITPQMGIGLGVGYLSFAKDSSLVVSNGVLSETIAWEPKMSAIPITLNFHYAIPAGANMKFVLTAGFGYYLAKIDFTQTVETDYDTYKMSANGFGAHAGVGLEIDLSPNVGFVFDLLGRFASVGGFEGDRTWDTGSETGGKFWYFEEATGIGTYSLMLYDAHAPTGSDVSNVREAKLDLSGFSAVAGFIFRF